MRAKLVVTYTYGSATTIVTDKDWLSADELGEWRAAGYRTGREWRPATVLISPGSCAGPCPYGPRITRSWRGAEIWVPTEGKPVTAPRGVAYVRDGTFGGAACNVYRARAGSYRFNA
ncbi:hypothetical protein [Streptomyces scabichelini]|uniref:hypothetical protein n=1 Tax=Streptomyces scabichelini TaxID=2711217 RepID=UPI001F4934F0|nr:hypothetical protein [Streptomyces scabichelini]